jgi:hypothetical protein
MAYHVSERTRELGIRMALGAGARRVRRMVLLDGMKLCALGLAIGVAGAAAGTRPPRAPRLRQRAQRAAELPRRRRAPHRRGAPRLLDPRAPRHARGSHGRSARLVTVKLWD